MSSASGDFSESPDDEYLENNCVDDPVKLCDFQLLENRIMKTVDSVYQVKLIRQQYYSLGFPLIFFTSNYIEVHCILKFTVQYIEVPLYVLVVQTCFSSSLYSGTSSNLPDSEMICAPPLPPPFAPLKDQKKDWPERLSIRQSVKKKKEKVGKRFFEQDSAERDVYF